MHESVSAEKDIKSQIALIDPWIHRWGCAASEAVLDPSFQYFQCPNIQGFIGYRIESDCAVAFGDPICSPENTTRLAQAFRDYCRSKNMHTIYIITSKPFAKWCINNLSTVMIEVGEELIFNPQTNPVLGHNGRKLRNKIHHAQNIGITVQEYSTKDKHIEQGLHQVRTAWLKARRGPQIYLGQLDFFENTKNRRWFYAKKGDAILGGILLSRLEARQGWLLKYLVTIPKPPRGTSEILMTSVLDALRNENCQFLTYGMVPAKRLGEISGLGPVSTTIARCAFHIAKWIFRLNQRKIYWKQFQPRTEPSYILFSDSHLVPQVRALMQSLNVNI